MTKALRFALAIALYISVAHKVSAQGGPPMITDDPGTPGNGHWENNLAIAFERTTHDVAFEALAIDLNYGWGDHIQLTAQTRAVTLIRDGHGPITGLGETEIAVKWRFLDEEKSGVDMSIFPRILFNISQSSVRRGLAEDGTRFQIPVEIARKVGPIDLDFEVGALVKSVGPSEWLYGIVGGMKITQTTSLMAEMHGTSRTNFTQDALTLNVGMRHKSNESCIWIASLGHDIRRPADESLALIGYCGVQFVY
jgi:hypothetical protein